MGRFGEEPSGWYSWIRREGYVVGLRKLIRKRWQIFKVNMRFEVGHGRRIKFWHDVWCGDVPFKDSFPSLFLLYNFQGSLDG